MAYLLVTNFTWTDYPLFWTWENYLIQYIGHDGPTIDLLTNAFGSHFAGGAFYASTLEMLTAQEWVLVGWGTPDQMTGAVPSITRVRFSDGQMSGSTGVNDFGVPFVLDENEPALNFRLALDEFIKTEVLSQDSAVNEQEQVFVRALHAAHHIAVSPDSMTITYGDGFFLAFGTAANVTENADSSNDQPVVVSPPTQVDLAAFIDQITGTLTDPSAAAGLQGWMWVDFGFGCWRCEWQTLTPEMALPGIVPLFTATPHFTTQLLPDESSAMLDGQNPYQMLGPEAEVIGVLYVKSLGEAQNKEALLWFTTWDDRPVWQAMLVAPEGFR